MLKGEEPLSAFLNWQQKQYREQYPYLESGNVLINILKFGLGLSRGFGLNEQFHHIIKNINMGLYLCSAAKISNLYIMFNFYTHKLK